MVVSIFSLGICIISGSPQLPICRVYMISILCCWGKVNRKRKSANLLSKFADFWCARRDLNPHVRIAH